MAQDRKGLQQAVKLLTSHRQSISEVRIQRVHTHPATICSLCYHLARYCRKRHPLIFFLYTTLCFMKTIKLLSCSKQSREDFVSEKRATGSQQWDSCESLPKNMKVQHIWKFKVREDRLVYNNTAIKVLCRDMWALIFLDGSQTNKWDVIILSFLT